jgi:uncharacterized protein
VTHPNSSNNLLRLNVGFLLKQGAGYSRIIDFDYPGTLHADDAALSNLHGSLRLSRTPQGVLIQGTLEAETRVECVRCLTMFDLPTVIEISELFLPEHAAQDVDENEEPKIITEEGNIDLTPIVREETILSIPMKAVCSETCKGLCPECGQNLNEGQCDCEVERIDPRLAPLLDLLEESDE